MANSASFWFTFGLCKQTTFLQEINVQMSIQYMKRGFKPRSLRATESLPCQIANSAIDTEAKHLRRGQKMRRPKTKQAEWIFTLKGGKVTTVRPIAAHCSAAPSSKKSVSGQLMPMLICQLMPMLKSKSCPTETEKRLRRQFIGIAIFFVSVKTDLQK